MSRVWLLPISLWTHPPTGYSERAFGLQGSLRGGTLSKEWSRGYWSVMNYIVALLLVGIAAGVVVHQNQRARRRRLREFATTAGHTFQLETCGGIRPTSLYEYLVALAMALRTQAFIRNLKLHPGEFEQVVTDAIESAYLLKMKHSDIDAARGTLFLFASCLDAIMSRPLSGDAALGDEGNFVGTAGAIAMLASIGWHTDSNSDLVRCALTEVALADGVAEYWRTSDKAYRDRVEDSFERVFRTALDPVTAAHVRYKAFSDLRIPGQSAPSKNGRPKDPIEAEGAT